MNQHHSHVHSHQPGPSASVDASPEREYSAIVVEVSGRDTPRTKFVVQELMAGDIADSMEDMFAVLAAVLHQTPKRGTKEAPVSPDEIRGVDMKRLLMLPAVRTALFNVTARAAGVSPDVIRGLDMPSAIAITAATVNANMSFFGTLPALLGIGKAHLDPASAAT
ncbi:hypothetical protein SAMN05446935_0328 [Burkholderia sp. YR290]|nr:hypothetical protein SAMN05446935_0328 [Burkholderia sp. YR290]